MILRALFLVISVLVLFAQTSLLHAQPAYMEERPTRRLALVIGNSNYVEHAPIASSTEDAREMQKALKELGFTVFTAMDVKDSSEFWEVHFLPFKGKIREDDFVLFYFSGHGLSYGGENFIAMLNAKKTLPESEVFDVLVAGSSIRQNLGTRKPGLTVLLLDACRTIGGSIVSGDGSTSGIDKGPSNISTLADNVLIGFSSEFGKVSKGRDEAGKMSYYTEALLAFLREEDKEFQYVKRNTRSRTMWATQNQQVPWFSESSSAEVYFRPSGAVVESEKLAWISRLRTNDPEQVWSFTLQYPTSRYVKAARKWLDDNKTKKVTPATTKISPVALDGGWSDDPNQRVAVPRIDGPYAFKQLRVRGGQVNLTDVRASAQAQDSAQVLASHGRVTVTRPINAKAAPEDAAPPSELIRAGTVIQINDVVADANGNGWLKVDGEAGTVYMPASRAAVAQTDVGYSLKEIQVGPASQTESLVDGNAIRSAVAELKTAGRSISRVSISVAASEDQRERVKFSGRVAHALLVLEESGVARDKVSAVSDSNISNRENIRVRFFGS